MWDFDPEGLWDQVSDNEEENRIEWRTSELRDNIFEIFAVLKQLGYDFDGTPYEIDDDDKFAIDYERR